VTVKVGGTAVVGINDGALPRRTTLTRASRARNRQCSTAALSAVLRKLTLIPVGAASLARGHSNLSLIGNLKRNLIHLLERHNFLFYGQTSERRAHFLA